MAGDDINLPLARVKRIIKQDVDIHGVSTSAVYAVSAATKLFIMHMTEQALFHARANARTRLTYADFAGAVATVEELEFLNVIVPRTQQYSQVAQKRADADLELSSVVSKEPFGEEEFELEDDDDYVVAGTSSSLANERFSDDKVGKPARKARSKNADRENTHDIEDGDDNKEDIEVEEGDITEVEEPDNAGESAYKSSESDGGGSD